MRCISSEVIGLRHRSLDQFLVEAVFVLFELVSERMNLFSIVCLTITGLAERCCPG